MYEIENMPVYQEPASEQPKVDVPPAPPSEYENQFDPEVIKKLFNEFNKEADNDTSINSNIS